MNEMNSRLKIVAVSSEKEPTQTVSKKNSRIQQREEAKAKFERLWLLDPEQFNPLRNSMERQRLERTWDLLLRHQDPSGKQIADLGCGSGILSERLAKHGAYVLALDIASNALKLISEKNISNIEIKQDYVPFTTLDDQAYDLVISTDLIGFLHIQDYRLFMSELSRLVSANGKILCSTSIDLNSDDVLERFNALAETELQIDEWVFSYHRLYIKLLALLEIPTFYVRIKKDPDFFHREQGKRSSLGQKWLRLQKNTAVNFFWKSLNIFTTPLYNRVKNSHWLLNQLEKICRFFWSEAGISHAIFIGKRRPLAPPPEEAEIPQERKAKRLVWE